MTPLPTPLRASLRRSLGLVVCLATGWALLHGAASAWQEGGDAPGDDLTGGPAAVGEVVKSQELGGGDRYLTHLSTDKPIYREGDKVFLRAVVLHHRSREPLPSNDMPLGYLEIQGPKGEVVAGGMMSAVDSVLGFQWTVPDGQAGGEYTAKLSYPHNGLTPAERKFDVRAYRAPRIKTQIEFLRDAYGPGDDVVATLEAERAEGGVPVDAPVTIVARVDGAEVYRGASQVDDDGNCVARFQLPVDIRRGEGTLAMIVEDGGVVETASKTIPILLQTVDLTLYPEGGELVAGLASRVYFQAWTPQGKPADLAGIVRDEEGTEVGKFRSEHEGRGRFRFTPQEGKAYELQITEPAGITSRYPLPEIKATGAVLEPKKDVFLNDEPVAIDVAAVLPPALPEPTPEASPDAAPGDSPDDSQDGSQDDSQDEKKTERSLIVVIAKAEIEIARKKIAAATEPTPVLFDALVEDGVLRVTVTDEDGVPLAERLIFRKPLKNLNLKITPDMEQYVPGGNVKLTVEARDDQGKPVEAWLGVTVTDDSVLEMIDRREQAPRLPVMVLLENDVEDLADAHVYLDPEDEQAGVATDLLLGTQGWRRFAFHRTADFLSEHGEAAMRALAFRLPLPPPGSFGGMGGLGGEVDHFAANGAKADLAVPAPGGVPADAGAIDLVENEVREGIPAAGAPNDEAPLEAEEPDRNAPAPDASAAEARADAPAVAPAEDFDPIAEIPAQAALGRDQQQAGQSSPAPPLRSELQQRALKKLAADRERGKMFGGPAGGRGPARHDFVAVRVYAHQVRPDRPASDRRDFTETLYWSAAVKTDAQGKATFEFGLNDSVTGFQVAVDGFTAHGALGSATTLIESVKPFYLEPKMPLEVTTGDQVQIPVGIVNATDKTLSTQFSVTSYGEDRSKTAQGQFDLAAEERLRKLVKLTIGKYHGTASMTFAADTGSFTDQVTRSMVVQPLGFPVERGWGGLIDANTTVTHEVTLPESLVPGSVRCRVIVYPSPMASMTQALERLIREPYGCFEQTSSSVYPLVMAQQYFLSHEGVDPSLISRSDAILAKGYERLIGFESPSGGFEWFGSDPGHDALTAYGLMEFTDMAQVRDVDPELLTRTRKWLLDQRNGEGQFKRLTATYHTWLPEPEISASYNTWALLEAGSGSEADLSKEIAWVRQAGESTDNTYVMALAANVLWQASDDEGANLLLDRLAGKQAENGSLEGATTSVVGSGGEALIIETTSLAALAWLKNGQYTPNVEEAIKYLAESCKAGRFGSTQSTILALKAIVAYDMSRARPKAPGSLQLLVDGEPLGEPVSFDADHSGVIELPDASELLSEGQHKIQVVMQDGSQMPYSVAIDFHQTLPDSSQACPLHLEVALNDNQIQEGEVTEAQVVVVNRRDETLPTPLAIVGIPGGLEVRHDQLKELVEEGKIAAYEVRGREVILYWRALEAEQRVELPLSLVAAIPGTYTGPASRAYLYYTDEHKQWVPGLEAEITAKK